MNSQQSDHENYRIIFVLSSFLCVSCLSSGNQKDIQPSDKNITDYDTIFLIYINNIYCEKY